MKSGLMFVFNSSQCRSIIIIIIFYIVLLEIVQQWKWKLVKCKKCKCKFFISFFISPLLTFNF